MLAMTRPDAGPTQAPRGRTTSAGRRRAGGATDDPGLVDAILAGDESAFCALVDRLSPSMLRIATFYGPSRAVAEEIVQETWLSVLRSLDRFEGRSSLKAWIFTILANCARRRAGREARSIPFSEIAGLDAELVETELFPTDPDADRFFPADHPRWAGCWTTVVVNPEVLPEDRLLARELEDAVRGAVEALPPGQRAVFTLRDIEGWSAREVCEGLELTDANQRVLLHRARTRVRLAMEGYLRTTEVTA